MSAGQQAFMQRRTSFVSTMRPTTRQRRTALAVACAALLVVACLAPFAALQLPAVPAFLPSYQSALVVFDLVTSVLLFGQYRLLRHRGLLLLACGYVFSALLAVAHALSFPGLFAPGGAIGAGPQTTAWLYFFWHAGFAAFILAYGLTGTGAPAGKHIVGALTLTAAAATAIVVLSTTFQALLPPIMRGNQDAPGKLAVAVFTWLVGIAALAVLLRRRRRTVLDLWLMVVLCVWIADTALSAVLNHARFDLGWYAGRVCGLLANGFVLAVLLLETGSLYARLNKSHRLLGQALAQTRRLNDDLEAFAGSLAHDLQQPLTTIASFAQIMERTPLPEPGARHLKRILAATDSARGMVTALLQFARLGRQPLAVAPVDLNRIVARARQAVSAGGAQPRVVEWDIAPLPVVHGDAALLQMAFANLLSNAVKYSRTQARPRVTVQADAGADGLCTIRVRDNGVGFDMAHAGRLFTPFERLHTAREFEGTGMGLANVRRIVERHGGSVTAEAVPREGAVFSVVLRAVPGEPLAAERDTAEAAFVSSLP